MKSETRSFILQIEHPVADFDSWKKVFDSDPAQRESSGVRRYRIYRPVDDPKYALIDLEFDSLIEAENFLVTMRGLWPRVDGKIITGPRARIIELVNSEEY